METVRGYIEHIVFRNEENGYTVLELATQEELLTCVGYFHAPEKGEGVELSGEYTVHKIYGKQLSVQTVNVWMPEDILSIERYLGSGAIKGIGPKLAARIVKEFGEDTFRIMEEEPERLAEVKGISSRMARDLGTQFYEKREMRNAMIFLQNLGISVHFAVKIYQYYKEDIFNIFRENPYKAAEDIPGIGFKTVDQIASRLGVEKNSPYRIKSGLFYVLGQYMDAGDIYLEPEFLERQTSALLETSIGDAAPYLLDLAMDNKIVIKKSEEGSRIYISSLYYMEVRTAKMLSDLNVYFPVSGEDLEKKIRKIEEREKTELDLQQKTAIKEAFHCGIMILSGGPGTGKTTTMNILLQMFEREGLDFLLAAPTGRAAKRMTEATGYEAQTIHRLLEVEGVSDAKDSSARFGKNEENPLEADVIVIDEMSMVDLPVFCSLLRAVVPGTRLILAGDVNQLPSVGPGKVLEDLISSGEFKVVMLNRIFRQAEKSDIVLNAHRINRGEKVVLDNKSEDFFFLKRYQAPVIQTVVKTLVKDKIARYVGADPFEVQVLTPMRKGLLGVEMMNKLLQEALNPPAPGKEEKEFAEKRFRVGDKVMQIRNNYQMEWAVVTKKGFVVDRGEGIFNGDMGVIKRISHFDETVTVEFDEGRQVEYPFAMLDELDLAYAITIHKSQGSEYPAVIIPLLQGPPQLYNRNLIYTGVTRARKCVVLVGDEEVFDHMVCNDRKRRRNTSLAERIKEMI